MSGTSAAVPSVRIATVLNALQPTERRVAEAVLQRPATVVELTAQELADLVGVGRSSVIRACQSFGYKGFPQLRVAIAAELAQADPAEGYPEGILGQMRAAIDRLARSLPQAVGVLDEDIVRAAVRRVAPARRVLVVANGLSSPVASDLSMRLTAAGRPSEFVPDGIAQQIAAAGLTGDDACVVVSGSGTNESSLRAARAAGEASAAVIALTSFATSPLTSIAQLRLVIAPADATFRDELEHTSRAALVVFAEVFVDAVAGELGDVRAHRSRVMEILSDNLAEAGE